MVTVCDVKPMVSLFSLYSKFTLFRLFFMVDQSLNWVCTTVRNCVELFSRIKLSQPFSFMLEVYT